MQRRTNILIVENLTVVARKLLVIADGLGPANEVFYTTTADKAYNLLASRRFDLVLWGVEYNSKVGAELNELQRHDDRFVLIVLSDTTEEDFRNRYNYIKADCFLNKSSELYKLPTVLDTIRLSGSKN